MINNNKFNTATIAEIYANQGYFNHAEQIYAKLFKKDPNNERIKKAYAELTEKKIKSLNHSSKEMLLLFTEWIELIIKSKKINDLNALKKRLNVIRLSNLK